MTTYSTANGLTLSTSGITTRWAINTAGAETQTGTSGNDAFSGAGGDVLIGGLGDDTYYLWDNRETVIEQAGQGIDTIVVNYWGAATLPNNVENLILNTPGANSGTGNALNNIIIAGTVGATLDGGAGNDILVGGAGADLFIVKAGNGSDAIVNFAPSNDIIRLQGYGITSFDQLTALGTQSGADLKFAFANGESLVLRNVSLSNLSAYDFGLQPSTPASLTALSQMVGPAKAFTANGWTIVNNVWNPGSLVYGTDYSVSTSYAAADLTKQTTFTWSFPVVIDPNPMVRAYQEISYGLNPYAATSSSASNSFAIQLSSLGSLNVKYDVEYHGNLAGFDVAFDLWLTSRPNGDASTITNEVMIWLHKGGLSPFGSQIGTYSDGVISAKIYYQAGARPYTAVVLDTDSTAGQIDIASILAKLKSLGVVSNSDYLASLEFGAEVGSGAGTLSIHTLGLTVTKTTSSPAAAAPPAPTIAVSSSDSAGLASGLTKVNLVTLSGTAQVGVTVQIFDGAGQIGTAVVGSSGTWSFATASLADGSHAFTAKAVDSAGSASTTSSAINLTVDATAPAAPAITSFSPDSNIAGDGMTNASHVTLNGTAEAGSTVKIFDGSTLVGTATASAGGIWSYTTPTLVDGTHSFIAKAMDAAGNLSAPSASARVVVDTVAPDAPVVKADVSASGSSIDVSGTAEAGAVVRLYEGATLLGTGIAASDGKWIINSGALADGAHAFSATATDAAGNVSQLSNVLDPIVGTTIESAGTTTLIRAGINYYLTDSGVDLVLKYSGAPVQQGQFGTFSAISADKTATGYDVVWKASGADQYFVWNVDSSGNFSSDLTGVVSGSSSTLKSFESVLHQDLNGDGVISPSSPPSTTIEAAGSTSLVLSAGNYSMNPTSGGTGPTLKLGGSAVTPGQIGVWTPIAAEAISGGYKVIWKYGSSSSYALWTTDSNGNVLSTTDVTSVSIVTLENTFHQDLNGDGVISSPVPSGTTIESAGSTSLMLSGGNYFLNPTSSGAGPTLKLGGSAVTQGQLGIWTPIGVEAVSGGYQVVWKYGSSGSYALWTTDGNGNILSSTDMTSASIKTLEGTFQQDLNGDGVISGSAAAGTAIESAGSTSLMLSGGNYFLSPTSSGTGPTLKLGGSAVTQGQLGIWTPIGVEAVSGGYQVVWKYGSSGSYALWTTDSNGNILSSTDMTSASIATLEGTFHQDLNGDGVISGSAAASTAIESAGSTSLMLSGGNYFLNPTSSGTGPTLKLGGSAVTQGQLGIWTPIGVEAVSGGYQVVWKYGSGASYALWVTDSNGNDLSSTDMTPTSIKTLEGSFYQDLNGDGYIGASSSIIDIAKNATLTLAKVTQAITIEAGIKVELTGIGSGDVTFKANTGTLILDHATQFTGKIYGLTGNGDPNASDILDLKDVSYGSGTTVSFSGTSAGGVLTVNDGLGHVANINLVGNYLTSTFNLSSDGTGGTLVIDPPRDGFHFAEAAAVRPATTGLVATHTTDGFVFNTAGAHAQASGPSGSSSEFDFSFHKLDQAGVDVGAHASDAHVHPVDFTVTTEAHAWAQGHLLHV